MNVITFIFNLFVVRVPCTSEHFFYYWQKFEEDGQIAKSHATSKVRLISYNNEKTL